MKSRTVATDSVSDMEGGLGYRHSMLNYTSPVTLVNVGHYKGTVLVNTSTDRLQKAIFGSRTSLPVDL
jgi:hypothetical protein